MASKYIQKFPIPEGFNDILHDLAKEVLRYQPEDIIEFCASYFKCLQEGKELDYSRKGTNIPCDFKNVIPGIRSDNERTKPIDKSNLETAAFKANTIGKLNNSNDKEDPYKENKDLKEKKKEESNLHKEDAAKVEKNNHHNEVIENDLDVDDIKAGTLELENKTNEKLATQEGGDEDEDLEYQKTNNKRQISITTEEAKKISRDFTSDLFSKEYKDDN